MRGAVWRHGARCKWNGQVPHVGAWGTWDRELQGPAQLPVVLVGGAPMGGAQSWFFSSWASRASRAWSASLVNWRESAWQVSSRVGASAGMAPPAMA